MHKDKLDGDIIRSSHYTYNDQGHMATHEKHKGDGSVAYSSKFIYDDQGNQLKEEFHAKGGLDTPMTRIEEFKYDDKGNVLKEDLVNHDQNSTSVMVYSNYLPLQKRLNKYEALEYYSEEK